LARVLVLVPDLMLASRVETALRAAGHEVVSADAIRPGELQSAELIVADVDEVAPESVAGHGPPVLGVHRHTDPDSRQRAEEAGVVLVVPRSRLVRELPELAERVLSG
jgi:hypothetical protein